eukprot:sb/3477572/
MLPVTTTRGDFRRSRMFGQCLCSGSDYYICKSLSHTHTLSLTLSLALSLSLSQLIIFLDFDMAQNQYFMQLTRLRIDNPGRKHLLRSPYAEDLSCVMVNSTGSYNST